MKFSIVIALLVLLTGCVNNPPTDPSPKPRLKETDFSKYEPYNRVYFMHDETSLSNQEIRDFFEIADDIPNNELIDEVQLTGQKLIVQTRGLTASGEVTGYGASIDGDLRSVYLDLNFIHYKDIELTSEQLTEYQNIHPLKDAITRASVLYGYGLRLRSEITTNETGVELDTGLAGLTAKANAGYYNVNIRQEIMGGNLGTTVSKLLALVSDSESVDVANSMLNLISSDTSIIEPQTVKRIGYLVQIDQNKANRKVILSQQQAQQIQQQLKALGAQQQQVQQQQQIQQKM